MSYKSIRDRMVEKYGAICMMEQSGIRYVPVEERKKLAGYRKENELITYHHIKPKSKGRKRNRRKWNIIKMV